MVLKTKIYKCCSVLIRLNFLVQQNDKGIDNSHCYPVPEELSMSEFSWLKSSWDPSSPKKRDSPPFSPSEWAFEPVEFTLNEEKDC